MAQTHPHDSIAGEAGPVHHGPTLAFYLSVAAALTVLTAISFLVSAIGYAHTVEGLAIILGVAVVKASLVGAIFMHLKYDWRKVYFMIFPVMILGVMMIIVLLPDIVVSWHH